MSLPPVPDDGLRAVHYVVPGLPEFGARLPDDAVTDLFVDATCDDDGPRTTPYVVDAAHPVLGTLPAYHGLYDWARLRINETGLWIELLPWPELSVT